MFRVCVFCGSANGHHERYVVAAREMARLLVAQGCGMVFGGGSVGLMGVMAEAALAAGGHVTGIAPKLLLEKELVHHGLSELIVVDSMHERKVRMAELGDAFIALPGGYGTLDELFEVLTLQQLGTHDKPCGLFNVDGFFDGLIAYLDHATSHGFLRPANRSLLAADADARTLLAKLRVPCRH